MMKLKDGPSLTMTVLHRKLSKEVNWLEMPCWSCTIYELIW